MLQEDTAKSFKFFYFHFSVHIKEHKAFGISWFIYELPAKPCLFLLSNSI